MTQKRLRVFLDTSVVFAAVLSPSGGSRKLFRLAEIGVLRLLVGPIVLRECEEVVRLKKPSSAPELAQLLAISRTETSPAPSARQIKTAKSLVHYKPDAYVLAEAIQAQPDWFVTHDKEHFLNQRPRITLPFEIGTPGDLIQRFKDNFTLL
jgi:predicted nucleic acid-binding protein